ncbi:hypothetical protein [Paraglaciecola sp. L3A3]|uniref:hypothetical protein n=1 Tax=Paraglaciecola sp. L3A3 TaxID=2686358 RepID=UPI00131B4423|nr:hypothetical protein [Paraglaciecola sp. L3A3]
MRAQLHFKFCFASILVAILLLFLLPKNSAVASETSFSGFMNIGLTHTDHERLKFRTSVVNEGRNGTTLATDSILGLQVNTQFSDKWDAVAQVVLHDRRDKAFSNLLEIAFLRYQLTRNWSAQFGRFSTNNYLYTDTRFVTNALTWVRPPLEMYSTVGAVGNMTGAQIDYTYDVSFGVVNLGLAHGFSNFRSDLNNGSTGKFRAKYNNLSALHIDMQAINWRVKAAYLTALLGDVEFYGSDVFRNIESAVPEILLPFATELKEAVVPENSRVTYVAIGGEYSQDAWQFIAEYGNYDSDWGIAKSAQFGYVSTAYNFDNFAPYLVLSKYVRDEEPEVIDFSQAEASLPVIAYYQLLALTADVNNEVVSNSIDQDSISIGIKWDFSYTWNCKIQFDHNRITENGSGLYDDLNSDISAPDKLSYNVMSLSLATTF